MELRGMRGTEQRGALRLFNWLFELVSDYGRSVVRPLVGLTTVWLVPVPIYVMLSSKVRFPTYGDNLVADPWVFLYSAVQVFAPVFGWTSSARVAALDKVFSNPMPVGALALELLQALLAFILWFVLAPN